MNTKNYKDTLIKCNHTSKHLLINSKDKHSYSTQKHTQTHAVHK